MISVVVHLMVNKELKKEKPTLMEMACYKKQIALPFVPAVGAELQLIDCFELLGKKAYKIINLRLYEGCDIVSINVEHNFSANDPRYNMLPGFLTDRGWEVCTEIRKKLE